MAPLFARMMPKDTASNVPGSSRGGNANSATDPSNAQFETEWMRSREVSCSSLFPEIRGRGEFRKVNGNGSRDKRNDEMIIVTEANEGTTPEMIVITSKIKEKSLKLDGRRHSAIASIERSDSNLAPQAARDSDLAPDERRDSNTAPHEGRDSDVAPKEGSVSAANKELHCVEGDDAEVASVSGVNEVAYKAEHMDPKAQAEIESKKASITQNIIKSIISCSDSVQRISRIAIRNAELLLQDICEKKAVGQAMKANNLLTKEQLESFDDEFNSYIKFASDIRDYISDLIRYVSDIATHVKRVEKKFLSNKDEALQQMTYFENQLCGHLLNFYEIALAGEKAREMFEKTRHEPIVISLPQESIPYEGMFINHLLNFAVFSRTFESAWDAADAYLDILHCLFILLVDAEKIPDESPQENNFPFRHKSYFKGSHGTRANSEATQKGAIAVATASAAAAAPTASEKRNVKIPQQIISKKTISPTATLENKPKALPKNKGRRKANKTKKKRR
ncbi:unnamed protein product [Litomosoides sigmodontis]|uniref:Uncharacterized protein n=1 Tax=Litomosoides sigmodontis TaxID=42156 RepID=A0A3P6T5Z8_LITSI|nr:unnamed protein product [Litomosoides sigmodontis]